MSADKVKVKKVRKPNEWLLFVKKCTAEEKAKGSGKKFKDILKSCSIEWKKMKEDKNKKGVASPEAKKNMIEA